MGRRKNVEMNGKERTENGKEEKRCEMNGNERTEKGKEEKC